MTMLTPYPRIPSFNELLARAYDMMPTEPASNGDYAPASMMVDVIENPEGYVVEATMPGVTRDQIDVELNDGRLNISIFKTDSEEVAKRNYIHRETSEYRAMRSFLLKDADTAGITAQLKDGILTVNVPKRTQNDTVTKISIC